MHKLNVDNLIDLVKKTTVMRIPESLSWILKSPCGVQLIVLASSRIILILQSKTPKSYKRQICLSGSYKGIEKYVVLKLIRHVGSPYLERVNKDFKQTRIIYTVFIPYYEWAELRLSVYRPTHFILICIQGWFVSWWWAWKQTNSQCLRYIRLHWCTSC